MYLPKARKVDFQLGDKVRVRHDKLLTFLQTVYSMKYKNKNLPIDSSSVTVHYKRLKNSRYIINGIEVTGEKNTVSVNDYEHNVRLVFKADTADDNYLTALILPLNTWFSAYWFELCYPEPATVPMTAPIMVPMTANVSLPDVWSAPVQPKTIPVLMLAGSKDRRFRFEE